MSAEPHMASAPAPAPAKDHSAAPAPPTTASPSPQHPSTNPNNASSNATAAPTTVSGTTTTGTAPSSPGRQTHEQLAQLLAKAYSDIDTLHRDLGQTKRRAEQAERVAQRLTAVAEAAAASSSPGGPAAANGTGMLQGVIPESVTRIIRELEDRLAHAELAREEAEVRRRFVLDQWIQVESYMNQLDVKAQEAKFAFVRVLREGVPVSLSPAQPNFHPPLGHTQGLRRPRTPSLESGYPPLKRARGNDGHSRDARIAYSESNIPEYRTHHPQHSHHASTSSSSHLSHPQASSGPAAAPQQPQQLQHHMRVIRRHRSASRSSASSIDVDEMLLQASTGDNNNNTGPHPHPNGVGLASLQAQVNQQQHMTSSHRSRGGRHQTMRVGEGGNGDAGGYGGGRRVAGMEVYPASQSVPGRQGSLGLGAGGAGGAGAGMPGLGGAGPGGQQQVYQTHIFAPPVTGAPVKKSKYGSMSDAQTTGLTPASSSAALLASSSAPSGAAGGGNAAAQTVLSASASSVLSGPNFPPTNESGQRICRQCGQAGRYKDGKCVEKWGPGPAGPGTVCDRCRKKMKRVERRGTLESQQQLAAAQLAQVNVHHQHQLLMGPPAQQQQHQTGHHAGLARSDTMPASANSSANTTGKGSSKVSHVRTIMHASASSAGVQGSNTSNNNTSKRDVQTSNVRGRGAGAAAASSRPPNSTASSTANRTADSASKMQVDHPVSGESDADADADGDGDGDLEGGEAVVLPATSAFSKHPSSHHHRAAAAQAQAEEEEEEDVDELVGGGDEDSGEGEDADAEAEILEAVDAAEESQ